MFVAQALVITPDDSDAPFDMLWWRGLSNTSATNESVYLLHSAGPMPNATLDALFTSRTLTHRKVWTHAFPVEAPVLDAADYPPLQQAGGRLHFVNAIETVASSMETSTLAARNAARIVAQLLQGKPNP